MKQEDSKQMRSLYEQWLESGESRAGFAKSRGIAANTFNYWVKKFQPAPSVNKASNFNQLAVESPRLVNTINPTAIIHFPSGARIELYHQAEVSFLKELVF